MSLCNIGKTVKDEVKLCYLADEYLLNSLAQIQDHRQEDGFILFRATSEFFRHCFTVHWGEFENHSKPIARMYFGHTGNMYESEEVIQENYIFFRLENHLLYKPEDDIRPVLQIPSLFGMTLHHYTRLDLTIDMKSNIVRTINRLMKRIDIATILNGKWEDDHKKKLKALKEFRERTLDKAINPELVIMQMNAIDNKNNGIIVAAYNKLEEIRDKSTENSVYKQYILDYYGNPKKSLHRLEVRVNAANITKYCKDHKIPITEELLFDEAVLTDMYYTFLKRVLRFTTVMTSKSGNRTLRDQIEWKDILCNKKL